MDNLLITGTGSGLGKHLYEASEGIPYNRRSRQRINGLNIIHCAYDTRPNNQIEDVEKYHDDTVGLTSRLLEASSSGTKFVFMSSVNVYLNQLADEDEMFYEDTLLNVGQYEGHYEVTKFLCEQLVQEHPNHLILRLSGLLGPGMREGSLMKAALGQKYPLHPESVFNAITYNQVIDFLEIAFTEGLAGTYNICAKDELALDQLPGEGKEKGFKYLCPIADNSKASKYYDFRTTKENVDAYLSTR